MDHCPLVAASVLSTLSYTALGCTQQSLYTKLGFWLAPYLCPSAHRLARTRYHLQFLVSYQVPYLTVTASASTFVEKSTHTHCTRLLFPGHDPCHTLSHDRLGKAEAACIRLFRSTTRVSVAHNRAAVFFVRQKWVSAAPAQYLYATCPH